MRTRGPTQRYTESRQRGRKAISKFRSPRSSARKKNIGNRTIKTVLRQRGRIDIRLKQKNGRQRGRIDIRLEGMGGGVGGQKRINDTIGA